MPRPCAEPDCLEFNPARRPGSWLSAPPPASVYGAVPQDTVTGLQGVDWLPLGKSL